MRSFCSDVVALVCWISLSSFKNKLGVCGCLKCVESIRAVTGRSSFLDSFALGHCFVAASLQFGPLLLYRNVRLQVAFGKSSFSLRGNSVRYDSVCSTRTESYLSLC